ncbi:hypothetical protein BDV95DRAFT_619720 [Massariosphaeria phaeospora]|uniref:Uncharacterized protein n=1 Tax=Massariosphaeria phaeospora TaxID=100035 RepID=A0A7C8M7F6_9PLEO|nr:hypothetical protein BDV95DRAFT_619720 [Massariosphaeria phaeospora]
MRASVAWIAAFALLSISNGEGPGPPPPRQPSDVAVINSNSTVDAPAWLADLDNPGEAWDWSGRPWPEPADDETITKAWCKGSAFHDAFVLSDHDAGARFNGNPQSVANHWTYDDLQKWGWTIRLAGDHSSNQELGNLWGVGRPLRELHLSDKTVRDGGKFSIVVTYHGDTETSTKIEDQKYRDPSNVERRCTGGLYVLGINTEQGAILAMNIKSPKSAAQQRQPSVPESDHPKLARLADVMFPTWNRWAPGEQVKNLRWYWVLSIINGPTRSVLRRVLNERHKELSPYPGEFIPMNEPGAQAILGTPVAAPLGYMLVQNKATLGNFYVSGVIIFHSEGSNRKPNLAFSIQPVPQQGITHGDGNAADGNFTYPAGAFDPPSEYPTPPKEPSPMQFEDPSKHVYRRHIIRA